MADHYPILLVDDDSHLLDALRTALELAGFTVVTAADGMAALAMIPADGSMQPEPLALIVIDVRMPKLDGVAFIHEYRRRPRATAPVIAMAALPDDLAAAQAAEADAVLEKPFPITQFMALVHELRKGRQQ